MERVRKTITSSEVKNRYNKKTYTQYAFSVRKDSLLFEKIQNYQHENPQGLSALIKSLLENHFDINDE
jgi:hypothetical protein